MPASVATVLQVFIIETDIGVHVVMLEFISAVLISLNILEGLVSVSVCNDLVGLPTSGDFKILYRDLSSFHILVVFNFFSLLRVYC